MSFRNANTMAIASSKRTANDTVSTRARTLSRLVGRWSINADDSSSRLIRKQRRSAKHRRRDPWNLSVFKHGAAYIRLAEAHSSIDGRVPKVIRRNLVRGLNG